MADASIVGGTNRNPIVNNSSNATVSLTVTATDPYGNTLSDVFTAGMPPIPDVAEAPAGHLWDRVQAAGLKGLNDGQKVSYEVAMERGKAAATNLKLA